jgi:hypothetical protein
MELLKLVLGQQSFDALRSGLVDSGHLVQQRVGLLAFVFLDGLDLRHLVIGQAEAGQGVASGRATGSAHRRATWTVHWLKAGAARSTNWRTAEAGLTTGTTETALAAGATETGLASAKATGTAAPSAGTTFKAARAALGWS